MFGHIRRLTVVISGVQNAQRFARPSEQSERLDHFVRRTQKSLQFILNVAIPLLDSFIRCF